MRRTLPLGSVGIATLPRPMAIQNSAIAGAAMMMANRMAVTGCGSSPVASVARLAKPAPRRPPSPVGRGQVSGAAMNAATPQASSDAPIQVTTRRPILVGTRSRTKLQPHSAGGISSAMMPSPNTWKARSAITAPGKPSQFFGVAPGAA